MNREDLVRLQRSGYDWTKHRTDSLDSFIGDEPWRCIVYAVLTEYRTMSESMLNAMTETEWPEGMSPQDQYRAMHNAVIDSVIGPKR